MLATNMSEAGNSEEKLRWAFKMYDKDGSGTVEIDEMIEIVGNLFELEGLSKVHIVRILKLIANHKVNSEVVVKLYSKSLKF